MRFLLGSMPTTQLRVNEREASPKRRIDCNTFLIINGLNTFNYYDGDLGLGSERKKKNKHIIRCRIEAQR